MRTPNQPQMKRIARRVSFSPLRIVAYILHATGLETIYKPRFMRHTALMDFTDEEAARLPRNCYSVTGAKMDPMNLVFIGRDADIKHTFRRAGWHRANPGTPFHLLYGALSVLARRPYRTGPFTPLFVNIGLQDLAYQQVTKAGSFKRRHHVRIWRTGMLLPGDKRVWVAAASFDTRLKVQLSPPFIHHAIDPNLDRERTFVVNSLEEQGALRLKSVWMNDSVLASETATNGYGAEYFTDGRAVVVEV